MTLHIIINNDCEKWVESLDPSMHPTNVEIAGKTILKYWVEWARENGYKEIHILSKYKEFPKEDIDNFYHLYNIKILFNSYETAEDFMQESHIFFGFGLFLDNGEYYRLRDISDFLSFEKKLLQKQLKYTSSVGYGKNVNIQIGKNVYIHHSVKLIEPVIIGDNCVIEGDVEIENSIISSDVHVKLGSTIKNSHISKHQHLLTDLYLKNKALFTALIYDINSKKGYLHKGICAVHNYYRSGN